MPDINTYDLLNERGRLINEIRQSHSSTTILTYSEKKRRVNITAESIARLASNGKSIYWTEFWWFGKIQSKGSKTIVVGQRNGVMTYDCSGKSTKKDCTIAIQFPSESSFGSFMIGDKVYFSGKILKVNIETSSQYNYSFGYSGSSYGLGLKPEDLSRLKALNPTKSFVFIFQTTKEGKFRRANNFQHDVDIVIEVPEKDKAVQTERFNQDGKMEIFEKRMAA